MTSVPNKFLKSKDELSVKTKAKDLTLKAKVTKVVLEDTSRLRTKAKDNNTGKLLG